MKKINIKRNGSHLYRNVNDENPFKNKWQLFVQKCKYRQSIQKEMLVIRTEMYMTKTHSKEMDSHSYKHTHDKNPLKRNGQSFAQTCT